MTTGSHGQYYHVGHILSTRAIDVDRKTKKRRDVLSKKLHLLQQQLKGAKQQVDDASDIARLEKEVAGVQTELTRLKDKAGPRQ